MSIKNYNIAGKSSKILAPPHQMATHQLHLRRAAAAAARLRLILSFGLGECQPALHSSPRQPRRLPLNRFSGSAAFRGTEAAGATRRAQHTGRCSWEPSRGATVSQSHWPRNSFPTTTSPPSPSQPAETLNPQPQYF